MKLRNFFFFFFLLNLISCGKEQFHYEANPIIMADLAELGEGTYSVPCFFNKLATEGIGINIYGKTVITLNPDGTGSNAYELYDDVACTHLVANGTVAVLNYETIRVNGGQVLVMDQDDGNAVMRFWIAYKQIGDSKYFDVDYSDGESGPYLSEPNPSDLSQFQADPVGEGVLLSQI